MRIGSLFLLTVAICLLAMARVDAKGYRVGQVPNGSSIGCALCHVDAVGGGRRNVFGIMVEEGFLRGGDVVWGPELAALDADGDGATNGQELLDPQGVWRVGSPSPGEAALVTLPHDPGSAPVAPTSVKLTTWARLKEAVDELAD